MHSLRNGNGLFALLLLTRVAKSSAAKSSAAKTRSMESGLKMSSPHLVCLIRLSHGFCHGWPDLACPKSTIIMFWLAATGDCML